MRNLRELDLTTSDLGLGGVDPSLAVWYVDLDVSADAVRGFTRWLSPDELEKTERFRSDLSRCRYIVGRGSLRRVLGDRLGCSPTAIRFSYGPYGKPMLQDGRERVEFNLAHSGGDAIIAVAGRAVIGVDIEHRRPVADVDSIAGFAFSIAERRELDHSRDPVSAFLNGWTRKEAYLKALGLGLNAPLTEITVSLLGRAALRATGLKDQSVSDWRLLNVPHPRGVVALALGPPRSAQGAQGTTISVPFDCSPQLPGCGASARTI